MCSQYSEQVLNWLQKVTKLVKISSSQKRLIVNIGSLDIGNVIYLFCDVILATVDTISDVTCGVFFTMPWLHVK